MMTAFSLESFAEGGAVLKDKDGRTVLWPKDKLPAGAGIGTELYFHIHPRQNLIVEEKKIAENILNEILNIS